MRLDLYLSEKGYAKSRSYAKELIKNGLVTVDGKVCEKASVEIEEQDVRVIRELFSYVGRGGVKLEGALKAFEVNPDGLVCADIGASTGGFTDCLLKNGAVKVYAVDSGHGQFHESLVNDERVINLEGVNARYLDGKIIPEKIDLCVCDLSFISQTYVAEGIANVLKDDGMFVTLIKPQFECSAQALGKGGIVKDKKYHVQAINRVIDGCRQYGLNCIGLVKSPIEGGDGNREFFALFKKADGITNIDEKYIKETVS